MINKALDCYLEKRADALSRAFQRGDIKIDTPEKQVALDAKIRNMPPRNSGNMGLMRAPAGTYSLGVSKPKPLPNGAFAAGVEGDAYLGSMRGKGLGVKKVFPEHPDSDPIRQKADLQNFSTRTVPNRVEHMRSLPEVYPEVYRSSHNPSKPQFGSIDMEFIPGKDLKEHSYHEIADAYTQVDNKMKNKGYKGVENNMYHEGTDTMVGDLHPGNVKIDARTGKAKILDPMVHKGKDPHYGHGARLQLEEFGIKPGQKLQTGLFAPSEINTARMGRMNHANILKALDGEPIHPGTGRGLMNNANIFKPFSVARSLGSFKSMSASPIARSVQLVSSFL